MVIKLKSFYVICGINHILLMKFLPDLLKHTKMFNFPTSLYKLQYSKAKS